MNQVVTYNKPFPTGITIKIYKTVLSSTSQSQKLWVRPKHGEPLTQKWSFFVNRPRFGVDFHQGLRQINSYQCLAMSCSSFKHHPRTVCPAMHLAPKQCKFWFQDLSISFRRWENLHQQSHTLLFNSLHSPDIANLLPSDLELRNHRVTKGPTTASKKSEW